MSKNILITLLLITTGVNAQIASKAQDSVSLQWSYNQNGRCGHSILQGNYTSMEVDYPHAHDTIYGVIGSSGEVAAKIINGTLIVYDSLDAIKTFFKASMETAKEFQKLHLKYYAATDILQYIYADGHFRNKKKFTKAYRSFLEKYNCKEMKPNLIH